MAYTLDELLEKYPPSMRDVDEIKHTDRPMLGPLDFLYIDTWEDLSKVGADLHNKDRLDCKDDINNVLDIMFVDCRYENLHNEKDETKLQGSLVAIVPYAKLDVDNTRLRDELAQIVKRRGFGNRGCKTLMDVEDEEVEE
jgi:hypothetical protein